MGTNAHPRTGQTIREGNQHNMCFPIQYFSSVVEQSFSCLTPYRSNSQARDLRSHWCPCACKPRSGAASGKRQAVLVNKGKQNRDLKTGIGPQHVRQKQKTKKQNQINKLYLQKKYKEQEMKSTSLWGAVSIRISAAVFNNPFSFTISLSVILRQ